MADEYHHVMRPLNEYKGTDYELSLRSGLSTGTIARLRRQETRVPHYRSVLLVLRALGYDLTLTASTGHNQQQPVKRSKLRVVR